MFNPCKNEFDNPVSDDVPISTLDISDDKKVELLISIMNAVRADHISWIDRTYKAAMWSIGLLVTAMSFVLVEKINIPPNGLLFIAIGMTLFGISTQLFFCAARSAHHGIGATIVRCQTGLRLCEEGGYLNGQTFFGYHEGKWIPPTQITLLQILHFIVLLLSVLIVASVKFW